MNDNKVKRIGQIIKYVLPVCLTLIVMGLVWVGKNSIVIGATISTVDKELKEAYLERDAYHEQMIAEGQRADSIRNEFRLFRKKKIESDGQLMVKINNLENELKHEKIKRQNLQSAYTALRDSIDHVIKLQRSAVEKRYKDQ